MYAITGNQCKAARALLNWSQDILADEVKISAATIRNFENGLTLRYGTVVLIAKVLDHAGIIFTDGEGVKRRDNQIVILKGSYSCDAFFEDLLASTGGQGGDVSCILQSHDMLVHALGSSEAQSPRRLELLAKSGTVKCLLSEPLGPDEHLPQFQVRSTSPLHTGPSACFIYGSKWAQVIRTARNDFVFVVFNMRAAAYGMRAHFTSLWGNAIPLSGGNGSSFSPLPTK